MIKNGLIAAGVFVLAVIAALFVGREKQKAKDTAAAKQTVDQSLDKIKEASREIKNDISQAPPTGPDSVDSQLRNDFTQDD